MLLQALTTQRESGKTFQTKFSRSIVTFSGWNCLLFDWRTFRGFNVPFRGLNESCASVFALAGDKLEVLFLLYRDNSRTWCQWWGICFVSKPKRVFHVVTSAHEKLQTGHHRLFCTDLDGVVLSSCRLCFSLHLKRRSARAFFCWFQKEPNVFAPDLPFPLTRHNWQKTVTLDIASQGQTTSSVHVQKMITVLRIPRPRIISVCRSLVLLHSVSKPSHLWQALRLVLLLFGV